MKIEWASHFRPDGSRRTPAASTMHGWLAKMRGTLIGDEHLRSRGMDEMRRAAANRRARKRYEQKKAGRNGTKTGSIRLLSFFGRQKPSSRRINRPAGRPRASPRSSRPSRQSSSHSVPNRRLTANRKPSAQSASRGNARRPPPPRPQLRPHHSSSRRPS